MPFQPPQPLAERHVIAGFDCGDASLNQWLQQRALANQRSGATRTFVVCDDDGVVKAYGALASGAIAVAASPGRFRRNMPNPIPVVVLARLAVCRSVQGQGIARALLADVFERVLWASDHIGVRGILVHAASPAARSFYLRMGFDPSPMDPNTLMLRLSDVEAAMKPQDSQSGNSAAER
jgi:GNAT superfamily N-acetyltransferase